LKSYSNDDKLKDEYGACDKDELLSDYREAKKAKEATAIRVRNISVSKAVNAKLQTIVAHIHLCSFHLIYILPLPSAKNSAIHLALRLPFFSVMAVFLTPIILAHL
jgi:hypothetical protein